MLTSSPSLLVSTPGAAGHQLLLPHKRYPKSAMPSLYCLGIASLVLPLATEEPHVGPSVKAVSTEPPSSRSGQSAPDVVPARRLFLNALDPASAKLPQALAFYTKKWTGGCSARPRWALRSSVESYPQRPRHHNRATRLCCHPANQQRVLWRARNDPQKTSLGRSTLTTLGDFLPRILASFPITDAG